MVFYYLSSSNSKKNYNFQNHIKFIKMKKFGLLLSVALLFSVAQVNAQCCSKSKSGAKTCAKSAKVSCCDKVANVYKTLTFASKAEAKAVKKEMKTQYKELLAEGKKCCADAIKTKMAAIEVKTETVVTGTN